MIGLSPNGVKIMVATQPVDFRRGMNGLVALVAAALSADPYCGDVFVFRAKRLDRLRCIYWDGSGMILATKWLESGKLIWPPIRDGAMQMTREEFSLLLAGIDWTGVKRNTVRRPSKVGRSYWFCLHIQPHMVGSAMPLRPDTLPQDTAQLTRIILSLDEENADLKARVCFLERQLFGTKSEKMTIIDPTQVALDLGDLSDIPVAANDDVASVSDRTTSARRSPARNIGRLPKHLPRYDEVIEPENKVCPCCSFELHCIGTASDLLELGWDLVTWIAAGTCITHRFGTYVVNYPENFCHLNALAGN